jgi:hypothetical protein
MAIFNSYSEVEDKEASESERKASDCDVSHSAHPELRAQLRQLGPVACLS